MIDLLPLLNFFKNIFMVIPLSTGINDFNIIIFIKFIAIVEFNVDFTVPTGFIHGDQ